MNRTRPLLLLLLVALAGGPARADSLDVERRVDACRAVERVLWAHRVWPESNPGPKPPFEEALPESAVRARVDDVLRKSAALATLWGRPVGNRELQAEIDRMLRDSQDPAMLQAMLDAVDRDPVLAAEAIARPALIDRLIRSWYASDARWHGDERREAERALASVASAADLSRAAPRYQVISFALGEAELGEAERADAVRLDAEGWSELAAWLGEASPIGPLRESDMGYSAVIVLSRSQHWVRIGVGSWPKTGFDAWWAGERTKHLPVPAEGVDSEHALVLPRGALSARTSCANDSWTKTGTRAPSPRHVHTAVWTGSEMIVWGGMQGTDPGSTEQNTGARYTPATDSWSTMTALGAPPPRYFHEAVWTGSQMIVWGGFGNYPQVLTSGGRYDPATDTWTATSVDGAPTWDPNFKADAIWTGSHMIVWDEQTFQSPIRGSRYDPVSDSWSPMNSVTSPTFNNRVPSVVWTGSLLVLWPGKRYDPATDTWLPIDVFFQPVAREDHSAVWTGSTMIVWGGTDFNLNARNDGGIYDPVANSWLPGGPTTNQAPARRSEHVAVWIAGRMVVWGGRDESGSSLLQTGGRYDPTTNEWDPTSTVGAPAPRMYTAAVAADNELILWGGRLGNLGGPFFDTDAGSRYNAMADTWVPTRIGAGPEGRSQHSAIWTGAEMVLWGGTHASGFLNEGWSYVPATDTWRLANGASAPTPRVAHAAVWTGTWMTVWGGYDGSHTNTGGRYDVALDQWYPNTTIGAPAGRSDSTGVWSGTRMIVWGGSGGASTLGTGGRYDPATDTWQPVSTSGSPSARTTHTAVWSGSSMIVWGGADGVHFSTGGRYDPATDSWVPTATSGAPAARRNHAAVWTGSRMVIWGGSDGGDLATGSSYDPGSDSWSTLSSSGAPQARSLASASWTGTEMIVWGGSSGAGSLDSGGRYRPDLNTWAPTTVAGAPHARVFHSGIWAGSRMVVWGGSAPGGGDYGDGAGYCTCVVWYPDADGDGYGGGSGNTVCDGSHPAATIARGGDCNDGNPAVNPGVLDTSCDVVDDDCDGTYSDDYQPQPTVCGQGVCRSFGSLECLGVSLHNTCVPGTPNASVDDGCNGLDDDCDGGVDDDFPIFYNDRWVPIANAPSARTSYTAVTSGPEMLVFGGDNGSGNVQTGGMAYDFLANTWRTLPAGPAKRWHHTAVWADGRMIVWGGDDGTSTIYNNGSRYDPTANTWAATTTTGAPAARGQHVAVWTGSRMVIWGGRDVATFMNTGSRYDPVANSWSATATTGAPAGRAQATAVWTGTEMIVWGGTAAAGTGLNTGGRYNPSSNTWAAVTTTGAPSGRYGHVVLWTGTEMLIWGGTSDGSNYLASGARYNPTTNTWTPMAGGGLSRRAFASAAVFGGEVWIWGGTFRTNEDPDTALSDGARYLLGNDAWVPMNPYFAPAARARTSAVLQAGEMIVWGGDPNGAASVDGARYVWVTPCGVGGCMRLGAMVCSNASVSFQCTPGTPQVEACDGYDNDCNAVVDDNVPVPTGVPILYGTKLIDNTIVLDWSATPNTNYYDMTRGSLNTLRGSGGDFTSASCLQNDNPMTQGWDPVTPGAGEGTWYLVRPVNACSGPGTWDGPSPPQQGSRDAELAVSALPCP